MRYLMSRIARTHFAAHACFVLRFAPFLAGFGSFCPILGTPDALNPHFAISGLQPEGLNALLRLSLWLFQTIALPLQQIFKRVR